MVLTEDDTKESEGVNEIVEGEMELYNGGVCSGEVLLNILSVVVDTDVVVDSVVNICVGCIGVA